MRKKKWILDPKRLEWSKFEVIFSRATRNVNDSQMVFSTVTCFSVRPYEHKSWYLISCPSMWYTRDSWTYQWPGLWLNDFLCGGKRYPWGFSRKIDPQSWACTVRSGILAWVLTEPIALHAVLNPLRCPVNRTDDSLRKDRRVNPQDGKTDRQGRKKLHCWKHSRRGS